jgi:hypothetical protein
MARRCFILLNPFSDYLYTRCIPLNICMHFLSPQFSYTFSSPLFYYTKNSSRLVKVPIMRYRPPSHTQMRQLSSKSNDSLTRIWHKKNRDHIIWGSMPATWLEGLKKCTRSLVYDSLLWAKILTQDLPNMEHKCYSLHSSILQNISPWQALQPFVAPFNLTAA